MVLRVSQSDGVLQLTLERPEKRNALSPELVRALREAFATARDDPETRAVLLTGSGDVFCAGGDIDAMRARHQAPEGAALATKRAQEELFGALARDILSLEKPVVGFVNGDAYGAGLSLVLACDHVVAAPTARFAATFVKMGLIPDAGGTWLLVKTLGLRDARRMAMLADPVDADKAAQMGIASEVGDLARASTVAKRWAEGPTRALGLAKRAIIQASSDTLDEALAREAAVQALLFSSADHKEGVAAFSEKRAPRFRGV